MTSTLEMLTATRYALHQVAEHVLAAAQYTQTGDIRLAFAPGGFTTYSELPGQRRVMVVGDRLIVVDPAGRRSTQLTTVGSAAAFVGIAAGLPSSAYPPATPLRPDVDLTIDVDATKLLAGWYALGDAGLRAFASKVGGGDLRPILWPEHFDLAVTIDGVNYGASPGDQHVGQPYLYVGPHDGPPTRDDFWNAEFGAVRTIGEVESTDDALAFFRRGRSRLSV